MCIPLAVGVWCVCTAVYCYMYGVYVLVYTAICMVCMYWCILLYVWCVCTGVYCYMYGVYVLLYTAICMVCMYWCILLYVWCVCTGVYCYMYGVYVLVYTIMKTYHSICQQDCVHVRMCTFRMQSVNIVKFCMCVNPTNAYKYLGHGRSVHLYVHVHICTPTAPLPVHSMQYAVFYYTD